MVNVIGSAQSLVALLLWVAALALEVFALVEAIRYRTDAYVAAGKWSKQIWVIILAVATAFGFVTGFPSLPWIVAVAAAGFFLADVRPALRRVGGGRRSSGGTSGPYGPW
jgi:hypothetical protein